MNPLRLAKTYAYLHNAIIDKIEHLVDEEDGNLHIQDVDKSEYPQYDDAYAIIMLSDNIGNIGYYLYLENDETERKYFDEEMARSAGIEPDLVDVDRANLIEINSVNDNFLRRVIHHFKTIEE